MLQCLPMPRLESSFCCVWHSKLKLYPILSLWYSHQKKYVPIPIDDATFSPFPQKMPFIVGGVGCGYKMEQSLQNIALLKPMNNPTGVGPSKGKQGTTRGKEKIF